jgi:HSP20 family molecular chaperone IbpA
MFHDKDHELHSPKADVRETPSNFYVDVELLGLKEKSHLGILWRSTQTLLVSTNIERPAISEDIVIEGSNGSVQVLRTEEYNVADGNESSTEEAFTKSSTTHGSGKKQPHLTVSERQIGTVVRAFNFPVDVNHEKTTAKLDVGLLRLVVPKEFNEKIVHEAVDISEG